MTHRNWTGPDNIYERKLIRCVLSSKRKKEWKKSENGDSSLRILLYSPSPDVIPLFSVPPSSSPLYPLSLSRRLVTAKAMAVKRHPSGPKRQEKCEEQMFYGISQRMREALSNHVLRIILDKMLTGNL